MVYHSGAGLSRSSRKKYIDLSLMHWCYCTLLMLIDSDCVYFVVFKDWTLILWPTIWLVFSAILSSTLDCFGAMWYRWDIVIMALAVIWWLTLKLSNICIFWISCSSSSWYSSNYCSCMKLQQNVCVRKNIFLSIHVVWSQSSWMMSCSPCMRPLFASSLLCSVLYTRSVLVSVSVCFALSILK